MRSPKSNLPIVFDNVTIFAGGVRILDHIELKIERGLPTVLIGPNGSGKTTLLRAAMGLVGPAMGRVKWGDDEDGLPAKRAILFQRPIMLRRSAAANIRYALRSICFPRSELEKRIGELLHEVGLIGLSERPARRMSGGEQQRLALARALARDPEILFLDEPTASLDPAATKSFEDVIRKVADRGIKIVMSTHDFGEARRLAGDVVVLHHGQAIEHATASMFFTSPQTAIARAFMAGEFLV